MGKTIDPSSYHFSKAKASLLINKYEPFIAPLVGKGIKLLELGAREGESLRFWCEYFENATVIGLDCNPAQMPNNERFFVYQGYQQDTKLLDRIATEQAPEGFDFVIDDCSHIGELARISFWHLFQNHLKPGGLYAIEDWMTGYISSWDDGECYKPNVDLQEKLIDSTIQSHSKGMVGFIKQLVDSCALGERAFPRSGDGRYFDFGISQMVINNNFVLIYKSIKEDASLMNTLLTQDGYWTPLSLKLMAERNTDENPH